MNDLTARTNTDLQTVELTSDLYARFIAYLDTSDQTRATYTRCLRSMFKYFSLEGIKAPTRADVLAYKEYLLQTGHKPTTVQTYITAAKIFFRWTAQENLYPNIADHIKGAKLDREHKKDYLTAGQVKRILQNVERDNLQGKRDYAILSLMVTCGLRDIEVSRANVEDLRALGDMTVLYIQGKGRTERTEYVKIPEHVEQAIRDYLQERGKAAGQEPLFVSMSNNSKGGRLSTRSISATVKGSMRSAGYDSERLTAHSLRHTAVTLSLLAGNDITEVQQFARHANITTTMIYNHALDKANNHCAEAVAAAIF